MRRSTPSTKENIMENDKKISAKDIKAYAIIGLAAFGAYQVGKLAIDWVGTIEVKELQKKFAKKELND
jgi:hypothetical protein